MVNNLTKILIVPSASPELIKFFDYSDKEIKINQTKSLYGANISKKTLKAVFTLLNIK
jgi:hypothetical protein